MDLKKLFVYVPAASEATFTTNVINVDAEAAKYANKIVFLGDSHRIWVKKEFYGTDPQDLEAIYTLIGGKTIEALRTKLNVNSGADFAEAIKVALDALDKAIKAEATARKAVTGINGDVYAAPAGTTYLGESTSLQNADVKLDAAIAAEVTRATNRENAIEAKLPAVDVKGSGLSVRVDTEESTGKKTYVVTADQSIWEFMGSATATAETVATVLNGQYDGPSGAGEGKVHRNPEQGDVWAVTVTDQHNNVILYACDSVSGSTGTWTQIGSAQGISGVNTTPSYGVNLTNTASVVGVTVTPGTIEQNNSYVVTGGAVWSAIDTAYTKLHSYTTNEIATEAAAREKAYIDAKAYTDEKVAAEHDLAYAYANSRANEAQANAYAKIEALDANITGDEKYGTYAYVSYSLTQEDGKVTGANVSVNLSVIENYVVDNLWEEYSAPQH